MALPLYSGIPRTLAELTRGHQAPNAGLIYEKFVDVWPDGFQEQPKPGDKDRFLEYFRTRCGDPKLLQAYLERMEGLVADQGGILLEGVTATRLVSGVGSNHPLETGFVWHRTLGVPYLPGSSLKGMLAAWARESRGGFGMLGEERALELFGDQQRHGAGRLVILDVLPTYPCGLELDIMNPHFGPYYQGENPPADVWAPVPVKFLVVPKGIKFRFAVLPRMGSGLAEAEAEARQKDLKDAEELLRGALANLGLGAKTAAGYGLFESLRVVALTRAAGPPRAVGGPGGQGAQAASGRSASDPLAGISADDAGKLFHSLDSLPEAERIETAKKLYLHWQATGDWETWSGYAGKEKEKFRKKYERVVKIKEILAAGQSNGTAGPAAPAHS